MPVHFGIPDDIPIPLDHIQRATIAMSNEDFVTFRMEVIADNADVLGEWIKQRFPEMIVQVLPAEKTDADRRALQVCEHLTREHSDGSYAFNLPKVVKMAHAALRPEGERPE